MKEVKNFIIVEVILFVVKIIGGLITNSYPLLASGVLDISFVIMMLLVINSKENKKYKGIISSLTGFMFVLMGLGILFLSVIAKSTKVSLWVILFVLLAVILRYIINCVYTNNSYRVKKGILSLGFINSNVDFYNYGVILGGLIIAKLSKWVSIFRYANIVGTLLIVVLIIYKGVILIINSFKYLENEKIEEEERIVEIEGRSEVKKVKGINTNYYGGIRCSTCDIVLKDGINLIDITSFVVTLQDYLLKTAELVRINLVLDSKNIVKKKTKVRSMKQDARNSRSRNSKANTKKKNTKKKNKKR